MADKVENGDDKNGGEYTPEFDVIEQPAQGQEKQDKPVDKSTKAPGYEDDERLSASQREEEDEHDDADGVAADRGDETAEEIEAKRARRRAERRAQKARQQAARERDQREMNFLRTRNEQLERKYGSLEERVTQNEVAQVEGRLQQLTAARAEAEEVLARAIEANNGSDVVKLNRTIRELEAGIARLTSYKAGLEKPRSKGEEDERTAGDAEGEEEGGRPRQRPDPHVVKNLSVFAKRHPWFDPEVGDEDTRVVLALDAAVKSDGFDPRTKDYWVELEERMKRRLPDRMKAFINGGGRQDNDEDNEGEEEQPQRRNGADKGAGKSKGPRMSSGSQTRGTGKQFLLSAERKQAMIEAGVWDDPELRDKYIRSYAEWDKANPAQAGRQ